MLAIENNVRTNEKEVEGFNSLTNSESLSYLLLYLFFNRKSKKMDLITKLVIIQIIV